MAKILTEIKTPQSLPENKALASKGVMEGRSITQAPSLSQGLAPRIAALVRAVMEAFAKLIFGAGNAPQELPAATTNPETNPRILFVANHYLRSPATTEYNAVEAAAAHFEDIKGLDRGEVLGTLHELGESLVHETMDIPELLGKNYYTVLNFASSVVENSRVDGANGALTHVVNNTKKERAALEGISLPQALKGLQTKIDAACALIDTLVAWSEEPHVTMVAQAAYHYSEPDCYTSLDEAHNEAKALTNYSAPSEALRQLQSNTLASIKATPKQHKPQGITVVDDRELLASQAYFKMLPVKSESFRRSPSVDPTISPDPSYPSAPASPRNMRTWTVDGREYTEAELRRTFSYEELCSIMGPRLANKSSLAERWDLNARRGDDIAPF